MNVSHHARNSLPLVTKAFFARNHFKLIHFKSFFFSFLNRYNKREEAQEAIASLNNVIPQGGNQPLIVRVAEEHGRAKAALYLPQYNSFVQNRGRMRVRNQPY